MHVQDADIDVTQWVPSGQTVIPREQLNKPYVNRRKPVHDRKGNVIGFQARITPRSTSASPRTSSPRISTGTASS